MPTFRKTLIESFLIAISVTAIAIHISAAPVSAPGELDAAIVGIPTEFDWGKQYEWNYFTVIITLNTYNKAHNGVVPLLTMDKPCVQPPNVNVTLEASTDSGQTYRSDSITAIDVSQGCQVNFPSLIYGQRVEASSTSNIWYFRITNSAIGDVSDTVYIYTAQFAKNV